MGTPLGPKYIPYTYMDPLGNMSKALGPKPWEDCALLLDCRQFQAVYINTFIISIRFHIVEPISRMRLLFRTRLSYAF